MADSVATGKGGGGRVAGGGGGGGGGVGGGGSGSIPSWGEGGGGERGGVGGGLQLARQRTAKTLVNMWHIGVEATE